MTSIEGETSAFPYPSRCLKREGLQWENEWFEDPLWCKRVVQGQLAAWCAAARMAREAGREHVTPGSFVLEPAAGEKADRLLYLGCDYRTHMPDEGLMEESQKGQSQQVVKTFGPDGKPRPPRNDTGAGSNSTGDDKSRTDRPRRKFWQWDVRVPTAEDNLAESVVVRMPDRRRASACYDELLKKVTEAIDETNRKTHRRRPVM